MVALARPVLLQPWEVECNSRKGSDVKCKIRSSIEKPFPQAEAWRAWVGGEDLAKTRRAMYSTHTFPPAIKNGRAPRVRQRVLGILLSPLGNWIEASSFEERGAHKGTVAKPDVQDGTSRCQRERRI